MVIGPTPPGTGVIKEAFEKFRTSYAEIIILLTTTHKPFHVPLYTYY
jgi:hypothetical protein